MELNSIPGVALAVVERGQVTAAAFGVKSLATGEPLEAGTPMELASLSKPFTAAAARLLWLEGKLRLDAPVGEILPELGAAPRLSRITVMQLLRHSSGLTRSADYLAPCCEESTGGELSVAMAALGRARPRREPGREFVYANSNYVLLAAALERVSGEPFPRLLERRLFSPLGMTRTTADRGRAGAWGPAAGHEWQWGRVGVSPSRFFGWPGASRVHSTAEDLGRYLAAVLARGAEPWWRDPQAAPYHWGWFVEPNAAWLGGTLVLEHTGSLWGAAGAMIVAPELQLAVAVLANLGADRPGPMARAILARLAGGSLPPPRAGDPLERPDFWAIVFTGSSLAGLALLAAWGLRVRAQLRIGRRKWLRHPFRMVRAVAFVGMAAALPWMLITGSTPALAAFPATTRIAVPLLVAVAALALAMAGIFGLAPRRLGR
jgi:CubicO group peptidase (beta-lactamase class C family)